MTTPVHIWVTTPSAPLYAAYPPGRLCSLSSYVQPVGRRCDPRWGESRRRVPRRPAGVAAGICGTPRTMYVQLASKLSIHATYHTRALVRRCNASSTQNERRSPWKSPRLYTARPHTRHRGQPSQDGPAANGFQPHYNLAAAHLARERRFSCSHLLGAPTQLFPPSGNKYYFTAVGWPVPWPARAAARVDGVRTLILLFVHTVILYSP